jgi:hypothetical protein
MFDATGVRRGDSTNAYWPKCKATMSRIFKYPLRLVPALFIDLTIPDEPAPAVAIQIHDTDSDPDINTQTDIELDDETQTQIETQTQN